MNRNPVTSSNIVSVGYDHATSTLEVEFVGGAVYQYSQVPAETYVGLTQAESAGAYFAAEIKGKFEYRKVS